MASIIGTIVLGTIITFLGYLIGNKKMLFLIAGYRDDTFYGDKTIYAKRMGLIIMMIGIITILLPFSIMLFGNVVKQIYTTLLVILIILLTVVGNYWRFRF
jgi:hypothetical protein